MLVKDDTKVICRWFGVIGKGAEALTDLLKRNFQGQTCKTSVLLDMSWRKFECIQLVMAEKHSLRWESLLRLLGFTENAFINSKQVIFYLVKLLLNQKLSVEIKKNFEPSCNYINSIS